jgi:hypothetical protein
MLSPKYRGVLAAALAALVLGTIASSGSVAEAAKGGRKGPNALGDGTSVALSWAAAGQPHWVIYSIERPAGGGDDLAVYETCTQAGVVVYQEARRFFYSDSAGKHGTTQVWVDGEHCVAHVAVIGITGAVSNEVSFSTNGLY